MVLPILLRGRKALEKDKGKLFHGLRIRKKHLYTGAVGLLLFSAECGLYARRNLPDYDHFATARLAVSRGDGFGKSVHNVRVVVQCEDSREEIDLHVGAGGWTPHGQAEHTLKLRHARPELRIIVFGERGLLRHEEMVGYCRLPLELLDTDKKYSGILEVNNPLTHKLVGKIQVDIAYDKDPSKLRLAYIATSLPKIEVGDADKDKQSVVEKTGDNEKQVAKSIDLMELLAHAQSLGDQVKDIRKELSYWFGWEYPVCTTFTAAVLGVMALRPQFAGMWFHSVFSSAMLVSYCKVHHHDTYLAWKLFTAGFGAQTKRDEFHMPDLHAPQVQDLAAVRLSIARSITEIVSEEPADHHEEFTPEQSTPEVSQRKWLLMRAAEYAGLLKGFGPVFITIDDVLKQGRRIVLWEDFNKAVVVTAVSLGLGTASAFVRLAKFRMTSWVGGFCSLFILATSPVMASPKEFSGSVSYFLFAGLGVGHFPKATCLEEVNRIKPWDSRQRDARAWAEVVGRPATIAT